MPTCCTQHITHSHRAVPLPRLGELYGAGGRAGGRGPNLAELSGAYADGAFHQHGQSVAEIPKLMGGSIYLCLPALALAHSYTVSLAASARRGVLGKDAAAFVR